MRRVITAMIVLASAIVWAHKDPVAVYLFAKENAGGFEDDASKVRTKAVKHVSDALKKRDSVRVVDTRDAAQVTVEIVVDMNVETGVATTRPAIGGGWLETRTETGRKVRAILRTGDYETELSPGPSPSARDFAREIDEWVKKNQAKLPAR